MRQYYNPLTGKIEFELEAPKQGESGPIGLQGPQGIKGIKGDKGEVGPVGPIGLTGARGEKGDQGIMGPVGPKGEDAVGLMGPKGDAGPIGKAGLPGQPGKDGTVVHYSILKPKDILGVDGDWAFCETNEIYRKLNGAWKFFKTFNMGSGGGGGGSSGAPVSSAYVTIGNDATLTGERALTAGPGTTLTDAGANSTVTTGLDFFTLTTETAPTNVDWIAFYDLSVGAMRKCNPPDIRDAMFAAPVGAEYLVVSTSSQLTAERAFVAGSGLSSTDGGANGSFTLNLDLSDLTTDTIVATDTIAFYDTSGADTNKCLVSAFVTAIGAVTTLGAIGSSPNANAATLTGNTLNLEPASASFGGVVTTGTQTFAGAKTLTGVLTTVAINPTTTNVSDIGTTSLRYATIEARKMHFINNEAASGSITGTQNAASNYILNAQGSGASRSGCTVNIGGSGISSYVNSGFVFSGAGTNTMTVTGNQSVFIGGHADLSSAGATNTVTVNNTGSVGIGVCYNSFGGAASLTLFESSGVGSCAIGAAFQNSFFGNGIANFRSTARGSFAQGIAIPSTAVTATLEATSDGSMARGFVSRGIIRASSNGAFNSGFFAAGSDTAKSESQGMGSCIFASNNGGTGDIVASGNGSFIIAYQVGANAVTASGQSSVCMGSPINAAIIASGLMSFQLCEGTNAEDRTLKIGVLGEGIRLMGTTTAPAVPTNGDVRQNSGGVMQLYSNGIERNIQKLQQNTNFSATIVGNVGAGVDTLMTYSLAAASLSVNGDRVITKGHGTFAANANLKQVRSLFNSTEVVTTGAAIINGGSWTSEIEVVRTGAATQIAWGRITVKDGAGVVTTYVSTGTIAPTATLSGAVTINWTGEATSDNDITQDAGFTEIVRIS